MGGRSEDSHSANGKTAGVNEAGLDGRPLVGHLFCMAIALADEQQRFILRMVRIGRFNNQSEVVREALRRMAAAESEYLAPPPLTEAETARIYGRREAPKERAFGKAAFASLRRAAAKGRRP